MEVGFMSDFSISDHMMMLTKQAVAREASSATAQTTEVDPNGVGAHTSGAKLDAGKNRVSLVLGGFARALEEVSRVGTFGANKYTDNGWIEVPNGIERYTDALGRHLLKECQGELTDPDSNLMHAAHLAWNALARLDLMLRAKGKTS
jgi:hypothetical protein